MALLGNSKPLNHAGFGGCSPISPSSPEKNEGTDLEEARGVGVAGCGSATDDDRIACTDCANLADDQRCRVARPVRGALVVAAYGYSPVMIPKRCEGFMPLDGAADQRTGRERWPGLAA